MRLGLLDEIKLFLLHEKQLRDDLGLALDWNLDPERVPRGGEHPTDKGQLREKRGRDIMPRLGHQVEASILARLSARETDGVLAACLVLESCDAMPTLLGSTICWDVREGLQ